MQHKPSDSDRRRAMKAVTALEKSLGSKLFGWAVRKHMAIASAERSAARIRKEADQRIARLRRTVGA